MLWDYLKSSISGPVYTGKNFTSFCKELGVEDETGIPYNPIGQEIIECADRTLKKLAFKNKIGGVKFLKVTQSTPCFCLICFKIIFANFC